MLLSELDGMVYLCRLDERWTLEFVSQGCRELTGYPPEDLLLNQRLAFADIIHRDDRDRVWRTVNEAMMANQSFALEYRVVRADGSERWVWERGRGLGKGLIHGFIQDITERHQRELKLTEAEQRYRSIFENATEGIFQSTPDGHYLEVNQALARIYGYPNPGEMIASLRDIGQQLYLDCQRREEFVRLMREQRELINFESEVHRRDGTIIWISENAHEVRDGNGELRYYEGTVEDITERKAYEKLIAHQATHDNLTNLPNRTLMLDRIQEGIRLADRDHSGLAVVFVDLDHFKHVNDSLGHNAGDEMIRLIAGRLRRCVRDHDTVARLGGDEFVLLLADTQRGSDQASAAVQRVLQAIQEPCVIGGREYLISCSIGVSLYPGDGQEADTLLKHADLAMYEAKASGRNGFRFFEPGLDHSLVSRMCMEQELRQAAGESRFQLLYQPSFCVESLRLVGAEVLLRWHREGVKRPVMPSSFIPLAEDTGLINTIGSWVLNSACSQLRAWLERGFAVVPLAVNLSARQFQQPGLTDMIGEALRGNDLDPSLLVLEVTESCLAIDEPAFLKTLRELRGMGIAIAMDDFGTGYSNMHSLRTMPLDALKIDRSFITRVELDERDRAIYRAMVAMAQHLHLKVIAEGVESPGQYEFLRTIGCHEVQGFCFSRPLSLGRYEDLLSRDRISLKRVGCG